MIGLVTRITMYQDLKRFCIQNSVKSLLNVRENVFKLTTGSQLAKIWLTLICYA